MPNWDVLFWAIWIPASVLLAWAMWRKESK